MLVYHAFKSNQIKNPAKYHSTKMSYLVIPRRQIIVSAPLIIKSRPMSSIKVTAAPAATGSEKGSNGAEFWAELSPPCTNMLISC